MKRLIITGAAMVSPVGTGGDNVRHAVGSGSAGIGKPARFPFKADLLCGEISDFDLGDYISDRRFRRAALISQYALASINLALRESSAAPNNRNAALIMAITHGALCYTQAFHKELIEGGPEAVSPIHFSDSVLNAPAGNASICFGIKGPVHTVLGGPEAAIKSIMTACRIIDGGEVGKAVVAAAEELNELSLACYTRLGFPPSAEGAGAIVIEREVEAPHSTPYCCIAGMASECNPCNPDAALQNVLNLCMDKAGLRTSDIDLVMADMNSTGDQILNGTPRASLTSLTGNAFATSVLWETVFSAMAIRKGAIPQTVIQGGGVPPERVNNVLVCTADSQGNAAALILSKHE